MTNRPSLLVGMRVSVIRNDYAKAHNVAAQSGTVVDVLFTAIAEGGMIDDRIMVIVLMDSGRLKTAYVNQLEKEAE